MFEGSEALEVKQALKGITTFRSFVILIKITKGFIFFLIAAAYTYSVIDACVPHPLLN